MLTDPPLTHFQPPTQSPCSTTLRPLATMRAPSDHLTMEPVDFFRDAFVQKRCIQGKEHLHLKFNPTMPVSEYSIDFSSLAPSFLSGTTVRLRCGPSILELRNCDEVWSYASEGQSSIDLSTVLPKVLIHKPQRRLGQISPSSEPVPSISKHRREDPYHTAHRLEIQSNEIRPIVPSTPPLLHSETDLPANKKRRIECTSLLPNCGPIGETVDASSSSSLNFYKIHSVGMPLEIPPQGGAEPASSREGKARETEMQTGSAYTPAYVPYAYAPSPAPSSSGHKLSVTRAMTETPSEMQTKVTNQRLRRYSVTPSGIPVVKPSVVIPNQPSQMLRHLPSAYGALLGSYEDPETHPDYPGSSPVIQGVDLLATTLVEGSESRNPLPWIGSDDPASSQDGPWWASNFYAATLPPIPQADIATQGVQMTQISSAAQGNAPETEPVRKRKRKEQPKTMDNLFDSMHGKTKKRRVDASSETGLGMCGMIPGEECFKLAGGELYKIA